jgi:hypothetical protein
VKISAEDNAETAKPRIMDAATEPNAAVFVTREATNAFVIRLSTNPGMRAPNAFKINTHPTIKSNVLNGICSCSNSPPALTPAKVFHDHDFNKATNQAKQAKTGSILSSHPYTNHGCFLSLAFPHHLLL